MDSIIKRYTVFLLSIVVVGTGITMITQAGLGTTAVASIPFVLSRSTALSFGTLTMLLNILWVFLQWIILRSRFEKKQFLQFLVGPVLGIAIDVSALLLGPLAPSIYIGQLLYLIIGSVVLAFGVFMQIEASVIYNPVEGIVYAIARVINKQFGDIKVTFDFVLVLIATVLSFILLGRIVGLREGTILSALLIGPMTNVFQSLFSKKVAAVTKNN